MWNNHSAPGGPTFPTGNKPREGKSQRLPCGCASDVYVWLTYCEAAHRESVDRLAQIAIESDPLLA